MLPFNYYEERKKNNPSLFDAAGDSEYIRRDGVSDFILERAKKVYGKNVAKEDNNYLWGKMDFVREITFTKAEKINLGKMTENL